MTSRVIGRVFGDISSPVSFKSFLLSELDSLTPSPLRYDFQTCGFCSTGKFPLRLAHMMVDVSVPQYLLTTFNSHIKSCTGTAVEPHPQMYSSAQSPFAD